MEYAFVYFILFLNSISVLFSLIFFIGGFALATLWVVNKAAEGELENTVTKAKRYLWVILVSGFWAFFVPSGDNLLVIITGGKVIQYVRNSEKAQDLPDVVLDYLTKELKED